MKCLLLLWSTTTLEEWWIHLFQHWCLLWRWWWQKNPEKHLKKGTKKREIRWPNSLIRFAFYERIGNAMFPFQDCSQIFLSEAPTFDVWLHFSCSDSLCSIFSRRGLGRPWISTANTGSAGSNGRQRENSEFYLHFRLSSVHHLVIVSWNWLSKIVFAINLTSSYTEIALLVQAFVETT